MNSRIGTNRHVSANPPAGSVNMLIERLKKIRALNGNPSMLGGDNYAVKSMRFSWRLKCISR